MDKLKQTTIETYDRRAPELAEYFRGIGSRDEDINHVFELLGDLDNPRVVEIGCGDGRDAQEILKHTSHYLGFDISTGMIEMAKKYVPEGNFMVADAVDFEFMDNLDAVFAFASLLHLPKEELGSVLRRVHDNLKPQGIFYMSLKHAPEYYVEIKRDQFGERVFYFYNEGIITKLAGERYELASSRPKTVGDTRWVEIALRKK